MSREGEPELRVAAADDADFLVAVLYRADEGLLRAQGDWDEEAFLRESRQRTYEEVAGRVEESTTYVIQVDGADVGRLRLVRPGHEVYVAGIQILPEYQEQGIGTRVLGMVAAEAVAGRLPVTLHVGKQNPRARRLYERLGFKVVEDQGKRERMATDAPAADFEGGVAIPDP